MRSRLISAGVFLRATESTGRLMILMVVEGLFVAIGFLLAFFLIPRIEATMTDANLTVPPLVEFAMTYYWVIVAALLTHVLLSGPVMQWLPRPALAVWIVVGMILPLLIVLIPILAVISSYTTILHDLQ